MISRRGFIGASAGASAGLVVAGALGWRASADTTATLAVDLVNETGSNTVYAYVTGNAIDNGGALMLLEADGQTPYYPASPSGTLAPLGVDCGIALNASGSGARRVTIPHLSAARIWFSVGAPLTFQLNPGPALVEPSVSNQSDPNYTVPWDFCELTYNSTELYANISFVDFVSLPIAISSTSGSGAVQTVSGLPAGGLATICSGLAAQQSADGAGWGSLVVTSNGQNLRALSPTNGIVMNSSLFSGYYAGYVNDVWSKYAGTPLTVDTQGQWGTVSGQVVNGALTFNGVGSFAQPSAADIFSCATGPFAVGSNAEMGNLAARISAAFNRSTLLSDASQPDGENPANYYAVSPTNHYARIVHATSGRGYAFPYDDVAPPGGADQSGAILDTNPTVFTVTVGGTGGSSSGGGGGGGGGGGTTGTTSAFSTIQAESYSSQSGTQTEATTDSGGGEDVGWIANGDWLGFTGIDFGSGATQFIARVASGAGSGVSGLVEVRVDSLSNAPAGSFAIANTGGWQSWETVPANMSQVTGVHDVYLTFTSGQPADFVNVNWFTFAAS